MNLICKITNTLYIKKQFFSVSIDCKNVTSIQDIKNNLKLFMKPKTIGIIGATNRKNSVGNTIVNNLLEGEQNFKLYFINQRGVKIHGKDSYKNIKDINDNIDLVVITVPVKSVLDVMKELKTKNVKGAVIITSGFMEKSSEGLKLENELLDIANKSNIRIIGPNCLGIINVYHNMNASFASNKIIKGKFSLISQSGAICTAILDMSIEHNIGFSYFLSIGSMYDVQFYELVEYLYHDENTEYILIYMESVGDINKFIAVCKTVCLYKPIILIKSGKTKKSAEAAISHTGSMVGNYDTFYAYMKKIGVLVVDKIEELFTLCKILNVYKYPKTNEICIVTNAGGPAILLVDDIIKYNGVISKLNDVLKQKLNGFLPDSWSKSNPVDILGDASSALYKKTIETLIKDDQFKNIIVLLTPQNVTEPFETAEEIIKMKNYIIEKNKIIICNYLGGDTLKPSIDILNKNEIPAFVYPEQSVQGLLSLYKNWMHNQEMSKNIPDFLADSCHNNYINNMICSYYVHKIGENDMNNSKNYIVYQNDKKKNAIKIIEKYINENKFILSEFDSKEILKNYNIPIVETKIFNSIEEINNYEHFQFPCAMKIHSHTITHKKDVGGIVLNIMNKEQLIDSYKQIYSNLKKRNLEKEINGVTIQNMININDGIELILGYYYDENFGPVILFGSGGSYVEIFKDSVLLIPPLNFSYIYNSIKNTKIYKALLGKSSRFKKADLNKLITVIQDFSELILDLLPYINECDINPLFISGSNIIALDGRFTLRKLKNIDTMNSIKYSVIDKRFPIDFVFFNESKDDIFIENNLQDNTLKKKKLFTNALNLDEHVNSITRYIHTYDFKKVSNFLKNNYKELHENIFFFTNENHIKTDLFAYELCNYDYDYCTVIIHQTKNEIDGLLKIEKRNKIYYSYIYIKNEDIFHILMDKIKKIAKKENTEKNFIYLKNNSSYINLIRKWNYILDHQNENISVYSYTF